MKILYVIIIIVFWLMAESCQKCELLEQTITYPPIDTLPTCDGVFYINKANPDTLGFSFFFNEFNKPVPSPFEYAEGTGPHSVPSLLNSSEPNFSALDSMGDQYVFEYYYNNGGPPLILFFHQDLNTGVFTLTEQSNTYVSPVFWDERLFAIKITHDTQFIQYEIVELNPVTGQQINIHSSGSFNSNSPFNAGAMSSVAEPSGYIYFLSGTHVIAVKVPSNSAQHFDIDPTYDPIDNDVSYFGVEFNDEVGALLAMKNGPDNNGNVNTTLVYIYYANIPPQISDEFNISAALPQGQDDVINPDLYSTTFDQCDNTYYITEAQSTNPPLSTNLIAISLIKHELQSTALDGFWYGNDLGVGQ